MFDQQNICPYTGLRSFTEEESIYFKGRDHQIDQVTSLLEKNKFLMLTGASGEGKSSLIYAGLIPNARAGFFKARYSNWIVADFRPERNPVANLAKSLGGKFDINPSTVETELRRGFSSLIDLYTNSEFYIDENSSEWIGKSDEVKKEKKRKASNLIILADQFEEFFTNPENFYNDSPSQDSQIVVNLLLETARIALKKNIPVYVVCTMRSDYIGQCSAFRGLPDYIGFSQFFVPRLKRKDFKQVIEEPAVLSGNRISQRLVERLVYDLSEGVDQLPILQHALNQIWKAADHGQEEMDLVHYAMVGGMPADELPESDQNRFKKWYNSLPEHQKRYNRETDLHKVIEIHANILYENAWDIYNQKHPEHLLSKKDAKRAIALTYSCLTKIDNSRAVRNRMSLKEIAEVINSEEITDKVLGELLNIFREEGNSFIRPFKTDDTNTHSLSPEAVLDITHESLIRNWTKLKTWANKEYEFYTTYLDLKKQVDRWKNSNKSRQFLLPVGPLSFFENWYSECRPNAAWIRRYSEVLGDKEKETKIASGVLADIREFLKKSARKAVVVRTFMKYGPQRIGTVFAIIFMALLTAFYWVDAENKQNKAVIERVRAQAFNLMNSNEVSSEAKAVHLITEERFEAGRLIPYLNQLGARSGLNLGIEVYKQLLMFDKHDDSELMGDIRQFSESRLTEVLGAEPDLSYILNELNKFTTLLSYDNYYNPSEITESSLKKFSNEGYHLAVSFFDNKNYYQASVPSELNYTLQQWLTFGSATEDQAKDILQLISPFENTDGADMFNVYYPRGSYEINGRVPNNFNGGYHTLASLYAATGNHDGVIQSFEEIRNSGQDDYFVGSLFNNYNHILGIFYQYGHQDKTPPVIKWLEDNYPTNVPLTVYRNSVIRAGYMSALYRGNIEKDIFRSFRGYFFPNLTLSNRKVFNTLADEYENLIMKIDDVNERNYLLAANKKRRAMFSSKYYFDRGLEADSAALDELLNEAIELFRKTDEDFLDEPIPVTYPYFGEGVRSREYKRRELFIYPDYFEGWFSGTYHTDLFYNYIHNNNLFEEFYRTPAELEMIHLWVAKAFEIKPFILYKKFDNRFPLPDKTFERIIELAQSHPAGSSFDLNLIHLILSNRAFERGDIEEALLWYENFDKNNFAASRDRYEYIEKTFFLNQMKELSINLALHTDLQKAVDLAERFEESHEKAFSYIFMAEEIYMKQTDPMAFVYLDSALSKANDIDFSNFNFGPNTDIDIRDNLILLLSRIGGRELNSISDQFLREIIQQNKFDGLVSRVYGVAEEGNFYRAETTIPSILTESQDLQLRSVILWQASIKKESPEERARWAKMDEFLTYDYNYIFYLPN